MVDLTVPGRELRARLWCLYLPVAALRRLATWALVVLSCVGSSGCVQERVVDAKTQMLVIIDTQESILRSRLTHLRVSVYRPDGDDWLPGSVKTFPREALRWPVELPLTPGARVDGAARFEVIVEGLEQDVVLAQSRVVSRFLPNQFRELPMLLAVCPATASGVCEERECHGLECQVCIAGTCERVPETDPTDLRVRDPKVVPERDAAAFQGGGRDASRGDGSSADAAVEGSTPDAGDGTCAEEGQLRCTMPGTALRQRCEGGVWVAAEDCQAGQVCDGTASASGSCRELLAVCVGNADKPVCDGEVMRLCDAQGNAITMEACASAKHCQDGLALGSCTECLAGEHRCEGVELKRCAEDGQGFIKARDCASAALCNAEAGSCGEGCAAGSKVCMGDVIRQCRADLTGFDDLETCQAGLCDQAGQQCDVCVPGAKSCAGNNVRTCNPQGQGHSMTACAAPRSTCTGNGVCVECTATNACPGTGDPCTSSACDVAAGTCKSAVNKGAACPVGVCDGSGACVGCNTATDCKAAGAPHCLGGSCVQCTSNAHCDQAAHQICQSNKCIVGPYCGDGLITFGELCDPAAPNWNKFTCSELCIPRKLYNACGWHDDCDPGVNCGPSHCWYSCSAASDCPAAPVGSGLTPYCSGACMLTGCRADGDCPVGLLCRPTGQGLTICTGCSDSTPCPAGKECWKRNDAAGNPTTTGRCR